jgi:hypothetical protein
MAPALPTPAPAPRATHDERALPIADVYGEYLARDARWQVIEGIEGLSPGGAAGLVRSTQPTEWLTRGAPDDARWLFDPALLDAAAQMAALWSRTYRAAAITATRYGRVVRYRHPLPARLRLEFTLDSADDGVVRGTAVFSDAAGEPVLLVEDLECTPREAALPAAAAAAETLSA